MSRSAPTRWMLLAVLGTLSGCSDAFDAGEERELESARTRWESAALVDYQVDVRLGCFCQASLSVFTRVTVREGRPVAAEQITPVPGAEGIPLEAWPTVPDAFGIIEGASHRSDYTGIVVRYDPTLGYPTRIDLRCKDSVPDCGATYEFQNLTEISAGS